MQILRRPSSWSLRFLLPLVLAWPARELATPAPRGHVPGVPGMNGGRRLMQALLPQAETLGVNLRAGVAAAADAQYRAALLQRVNAELADYEQLAMLVIAIAVVRPPPPPLAAAAQAPA